jgi:hypothetical protein
VTQCLEFRLNIHKGLMVRNRLNQSLFVAVIAKPVLFRIVTAVLIGFSLVNRLVDRNSSGDWTFLNKPLQLDGRNYLYFALNNVGGMSVQSTLLTLKRVFDESVFGVISSELTQWQLGVLNSRPIYPLLVEAIPLTNKTLSLLLPPIIAWILLVSSIAIYISRHFGNFISFIIVFLMSSSFYVRYNYISSTPDVIAGLFFFLSITLLIIKKKSIPIYIMIFLSALSAMFTRPMAPIYIMIGFIALLSMKQKIHNRILIISLGVVGIFHMLAMNLLFKQLSSEVGLNQSSYFDIFTSVIGKLILIPKIVAVEIGMVAVNDPILGVLLVFIFFGLFVSESGTTKVIFIGTLIAVFLMAAMNGTIGNGFRYQMPIIVCGVLLVPETFRWGILFYRTHLTKD